MSRAALRGIAFMVAATFVFAVMDGLSRYLAGRYNTLMVVMIRYWFFAGFVVVQAWRAPGGLRAAVASRHPWLQGARGLMLALEICLTVSAFVLLGLIETHALFASAPLMIVALSGPLLGERVGWRRWVGIAAGLVGVLIILQPGRGVLSPWAVVALAAALMYALYGILTRKVAADDGAATSFFWTGVVGALAMTAVGLWFWQPMQAGDWGWMAALCASAVLGHWLLIQCYDHAEASLVQPFAYLQLVFVAVIGVTVFDEAVGWNVILGAGVVVAAGVFSLWRANAP